MFGAIVYKKRCNLSIPKTKRLQNIDMSEFLVANNIKAEEELMSKAQEI